MWNGFIGQRIAASAKAFRWWAIALFLVAALMSAAWTKTALNLMHGPKRLDEAALGAISDPTPPSRDYATVQGTDPTPTGYAEITTETNDAGIVQSKRTTADYMVLFVGKRALLVKVVPGNKATTYTGTIVPFPSDVKAKLASDLADDPKTLADFLPVMLDATDDYGDGIVPVGIFVIGLVAAGLWTLIKSKKYRENPESHPICKGLSQYGSLYTLVPEIDEESKTAGVVGGATITRNWIICGRTVMRRDEIVWAYKKRTKHSVNFIPTGTTFAMVVRDTRGKLIEIANSEQNVDSHLMGWAEQMPWVVFGYDSKREKLYRKQRAGFVGVVSERKTAVQVGRS